MKKLFLAALCVSAIAAPASAAELVFNGGFEDGLNGWFTSNTLSTAVSPSGAHSGNAAAVFTSPEQDGTDFASQMLATIVGETYTLSYWVLGQSNLPVHDAFGVGWGDDLVESYYDVGITNGYVNVVNYYVATSALTSLTFYGYNDLGLFVLDDVSVTGPIANGGGGVTVAPDIGGAVPEPATWALMLAGFGLMGGTLRHRRAQAAFA